MLAVVSVLNNIMFDIWTTFDNYIFHIKVTIQVVLVLPFDQICYFSGGAGIARQRLPSSLHPQQQPRKCSPLAVLENQRIVSASPFSFVMCVLNKSLAILSKEVNFTILHCSLSITLENQQTAGVFLHHA